MKLKRLNMKKLERDGKGKFANKWVIAKLNYEGMILGKLSMKTKYAIEIEKYCRYSETIPLNNIDKMYLVVE